MTDFVLEIAARAWWSIPVAIVAWFIARRFIPRPLAGTRPAAVDGAEAAHERPPMPFRMLALLAAAVVLWALVVGMGALLTRVLTPVNAVDNAVMAWIGDQRADVATSIAVVIDHAGDTPGIIAVLLIAASIAHAVTRNWRPALLILVATAGETAIFLAAQAVTSRPRPDIERLAVEPATSSFPSGHVAASIVTYGCIALLVTAWSRGVLRYIAVATAVILPLGVVWARLYQGMHYPSDVLVSMIFAPIWLATCWWAFRAWPSRSSRTRVRAEQSEGYSFTSGKDK